MRSTIAFLSIVVVSFYFYKTTIAQPSSNEQLNYSANVQQFHETYIPSVQNSPGFQPSIHAENDQIIVTVEGVGDSRSSALDQAWLEAIRLAVGMMIEARTEIDQDQVAEKIIAHSRGVVEGYEILGADQEAGVFRLRMQAKVRKDILRDGLQFVASKGQVISFSPNDLKPEADISLKDLESQDSAASTEVRKTLDGANLLSNFLKKYKSEDFISTKSVSKLRAVDNMSDSFEMDFEITLDEDKYYKVYLPELERVLEQISESRTKKYFTDKNTLESIRALRKDGVKMEGGRSIYEIPLYENKGVIIPDKSNNFAYFAYHIPEGIINQLDQEQSNRSMIDGFSFSIEFLDENNNEVYKSHNHIPFEITNIGFGKQNYNLKNIIAVLVNDIKVWNDNGGTSLRFKDDKILFTGEIKEGSLTPSYQQSSITNVPPPSASYQKRTPPATVDEPEVDLFYQARLLRYRF